MTATQIPNLFKVPELKEKILFTLLCLVIYRVGAHVATPGVNVQALSDFLASSGSGTLFGLYDLFAGGAFGRATVFALGIMPYISASIFVQIAGAVIPTIEKKMSRLIPFPIPRSVICSPSHMMNTPPVVSVSIVVSRKAIPEPATAPGSCSVNTAKP